MSTKLIGLSMVRNESDIIETFVRHNLTLLDELHIIDHNSSDNTREILTYLKVEGLPLHIYHYNELEFSPERILNQIMRNIINNDESIDYIFPLDADELIYCPSRQRLNYFLTQILKIALACTPGEGIYLTLPTIIRILFVILLNNVKKERLLLK